MAALYTLAQPVKMITVIDGGSTGVNVSAVKNELETSVTLIADRDTQQGHLEITNRSLSDDR